MSNASMGERLALAPRTVEQTRTRLKFLGLHEPLRRRDARNLGWVATLPAECRPMTNRVAGPEAARLGRMLGEHVKARDEWHTSQRVQNTPASGFSTHSPAHAPRGGEGVGGRGPASVVESEAQLPPVVTEDGVEGGASSTRRRGRMEKLTETDFVRAVDRARRVR
jgi:hypothetical protein